jgi:hypothetical protein
MRTDQTAHFVATRPYADGRKRRQAVYEHNTRVTHARRREGDAALAAEPTLTISGETIYSDESGECCKCQHRPEKVFGADSETHRIVNRSGNPVRRVVGLCVQCWSRLVRTDEDRPDAPDEEVRWG